MIKSRPALVVLAALLCSAGCTSHPGTARAANEPGVPRDGAARGAELTEVGCVSGGPERCFDATDDNCNGIIDEGCGIETGPVQFAIAWEPARVDVDLLVTDPAGELAEVGRPLASGLVKQRDCTGRNNECRGRNLENVYLEGPEAPRGTYKVRILLESLGGENPPVTVRFGARAGGRSYNFLVRLDRLQAAYEGDFSG